MKTLGSNSWHPLGMRLETVRVRPPDAHGRACKVEDLIRFRIDMRDGHCIVHQQSSPDPHQFTERLQRHPLKLTQETLDLFTKIEAMATSLMRGEADPWLYIYNVECKYIEVYVDPDNGSVFYKKNNFGQMVTLADIVHQDPRPVPQAG